MSTLLQILIGIAASIIATLCVAGIVTVSRFLVKRWWRRQFRKVFGLKAREYYLAYAGLEVHPSVLSLVQAVDAQLARFPLAKPARPNMSFSAQQVVSSCEIRAATYLESTLGKNAGISAHVVADESIVGKLDLDFISFGATSNLKTIDVLRNAANSLVDYDPATAFFISKTSGQPLCNFRTGYDYGIILKIHPGQFQMRTWIACAGWGEWGTSGSAWFLANKWRDIAKELCDDEHYVCVIEVLHGQDESASLLALRK